VVGRPTENVTHLTFMIPQLGAIRAVFFFFFFFFKALFGSLEENGMNKL
jgi:hypothetical protein